MKRSRATSRPPPHHQEVGEHDGQEKHQTFVLLFSADHLLRRMDWPAYRLNFIGLNKILDDLSYHRLRNFLHHDHVLRPDIQAVCAFPGLSPTSHERH